MKPNYASLSPLVRPSLEVATNEQKPNAKEESKLMSSSNLALETIKNSPVSGATSEVTSIFNKAPAANSWSDVTVVKLPSGDVVDLTQTGGRVMPARTYSNKTGARWSSISKNMNTSRDRADRYIDPQVAARARAGFQSLFGSDDEQPKAASSAMAADQELKTPEILFKKSASLTDQPEGNVATDQPEDPIPTTNPPKRTFLLPADPALRSGIFATMTTQSLTSSTKQDETTHLRLVAEDTININSLHERLQFMSPVQRLGWLILATEQEIKPLTREQGNDLIQQLMQDIDDESFYKLHDTTFWVAEPFTQIRRYSDGRLHRTAEIIGNLPGHVGIWISANKLLSAEPAKRSANSQRINSISLAGLIIASNRFETMQWMTPSRLDPLRASAHLGCSVEFESKGHDIGTVNGYALGLIAHSSQFFSWVTQWKTVLREKSIYHEKELSSALALAIRVWSAAHHDINQHCAQRAAVMLELGALITEWGLQSFAPNGRQANKTALAWARFCSQCFGMDNNGLAAERVMHSARIMGFNLKPNASEPSAMAIYAQADNEHAVVKFLQYGFSVDVPDASGKSVLMRAREAKALKTQAIIEAHLQGLDVSKIKLSQDLTSSGIQTMATEMMAKDLMTQKESLENLLTTMHRISQDVYAMDNLIGFGHPLSQDMKDLMLEIA